MKQAKSWRTWLLILILVLSLGLGILLYRWRKQRLKDDRVSALRETQPLFGVMGLSEAEVAARKADFDLESEQRREDRKFLTKAIRQSLSATYNIDLFGIAIILYLLGNPMAAFGTSLLVLLNLVLNVFQEMYTKKNLNEILKDLRPQANVIRGGRLRGIDPAQIVEGDYLVVSEGDEFLVDGELVGSGQITIEKITPLEGIQSTKGPGDFVRAGSYCLQGSTIYRAHQAGLDQYRFAPGHKLHLLLDERTPLQQFMEIVFRALFGLVLAFGLLLLVDALITRADLVSTAYQDAFSTLFGIAPTSLIFVLIITYAVGTLRIADRGALVYEATSIEKVANASFLCISKECLVSGLHINLEPIESAALPETLSESLIQRLLGDFIHSMPNLNPTDQMLAQALPGKPRRMIEIAPLLFEHGWYGGVFDEPDLSGTFVLGLSDVIDDHLVLDRAEIQEEADRLIHKTRRNINPWVKRLDSREDPELGETVGPAYKLSSVAADAETKPALKPRLLTRLDRLFSPMEDQAYFESQAQNIQAGIRLTFAYLPQLNPLFNQHDQPQIPAQLIPLAHLQISEVMRPEAENTIQSLVDTGLRIKILSPDPPEESLPTALELGLPPDDLSMISGNEFDHLDGDHFAQKMLETDLIGDLKPSHKAEVVNALNTQGEGVIMVGSNVADVPALLVANLRVALKNSSQAALKLTDIVLLKDSLAALPHVLITGQRLVNGVLDVFKLYLSQTIAQLILILLVLFVGSDDFPVHPTQAGAISTFAITVPTSFLGVWAASGRITDRVVRRQLAHFIIPASLTTAFLAWGVHAFFLYRTHDLEYAEVTATYSLLMAGWLRVLFVQPPSPFWVGGAPLRGDRRVIGVVFGSILLFLVVISIPFFQESLRTPWLSQPIDYAWIILAVAIWALFTRAIWRSNWWNKLIDKI